MGKLQLKRSNVIENGQAKEPLPPMMEFGELAVNYNADDPVIFIKNHLGDIIRLVAPGQDGLKGNKGEAGTEGLEGSEGLKGAKGESGIKGQKGLNGVPGTPGAQGFKGNKGEEGPVGNKGRRGEKGWQGQKGAAGDKGDRGHKGDKGAKGAKGAVTVVGDIIDLIPVPGPPTVQCNVDQTIIIDSDGVAWICLNGSWESIGTIVGPEGQPGGKGAKGPQGIKGKKGETGGSGSEGEKGSKGENGQEGIKGKSGEKGAKGNIGPTGGDGVKGSKGEVGVKGIKGGKGVNGLEGPKGPKGKKGAKGVEGPRGFGDKGNQGDRGEKGHKGARGPKGIKGAQGEKGIDGVIGSIDGAVKGDGPPPTSDCTIEGQLFVDENGVVYRCDGAGGWDSLGPISGPPGTEGEKGADGVKGERGEKGDTGPEGPDGEDGQPGQKGAAGTKGPKGEVGEIGPEGVGEKGADGEKGIKGKKGEVGEQGIKGDDGIKGAKGKPSTVPGPKGPKGQEGIQGGVGTKGAKGEPSVVPGPEGPKGEDGTDGNVGAKGAKGKPGEDGAGSDGVKGKKGEPSVVPGPKGDDGDPGPKGDDGPPGPKGDDFTYDDFTPEQLEALKGEKGIPGSTVDATSFWNHIEYVKGGSDDEYRDSYTFHDKADEPGKTIRRVYFFNNQLRIELASFSPSVTAQGQSKLWDEPASQFSVTVDNPSDYADQYLAQVSSITSPVGMHPTVGDYTTSGPTPTPGGGVTWTQVFETNATAKILSSGTGLNGGAASGTLQLVDEDGETSPETASVSFSWISCGSSLSVAPLTGFSFLDTYSLTTYSVSVGGIADSNNYDHSITATGGTPNNASNSGVLNFTQPIHKDNSDGLSVQLTTTFRRPAAVTGTAYSVDSTKSEAVSVSFIYPSWLIFTADRNTPPTVADVISGNSFKPEIVLKGNEVRRLNETINNPEQIPQALWFAVRSSAAQPSLFKIGENANLIFEVDYTTTEIELQPDSPPSGYTPERYTLYGITLQSGNTYVSIN